MKDVNRASENKRFQLAQFKDNFVQRFYVIVSKYMPYYIPMMAIVFSFMYGFQIFRHADILSMYGVYQYVIARAWFSHVALGFVFMVSSVIKLVGLLAKNRVIKRIGLVALSFSWTFYAVAFMFSSPPNTVWLNSLVMMTLCWKIAYDER